MQGGAPTEHWTDEGKLYLCAIKDCFSTRIVGYSIADRMTADLACSALRNAIALRGPHGTVVHSDRGSQGGFNRSSQHRAARTSVPVRQRLPLEFSNRALSGGGC
ncbi:putative transposase orfB for insertion sequence element [Rhodococcus opacus M213]|uniref:Putative transposase orfB for insertion sequence element n=1 Tax=Rhodococcus opacus M213 TaxID=1129896 RepID=K8XCB1_RHOOP|nr:putative transposase orfB for insertion sequence element [Rhodococcus opacus M213]